MTCIWTQGPGGVWGHAGQSTLTGRAGQNEARGTECSRGIPQEGSLDHPSQPPPPKRGPPESDCLGGHGLLRLAVAREGEEPLVRDPRRGETEEVGVGLGLSQGAEAPIPP